MINQLIFYLVISFGGGKKASMIICFKVKARGVGQSIPGFVAGWTCLRCVPVCPRIKRAGRVNAGLLGSVHWWLPGWQEVEWEQKDMSGRALALQIGSEMAPRPFAGRVNWTLIKHSEGCTCQRAGQINPAYKRPPENQYPTETLTHAIMD